MKKFLSILIAALMLMQMFTFAVSSEEASMYAYWTGEGPAEIVFSTIAGVDYYDLKLYRNEKLVEQTSCRTDSYERAETRHCFFDGFVKNGSGTYRAEVLYPDGVSVSTDKYYYKKPSNALDEVENLEFNQRKNYVVWNGVEGASLYVLDFVFSTDGGHTFYPVCSYLLDAQEDGTFFDFWGNPEDELKWIEENYEQAIIDHEATAENFIRAIQVVAYPADLNNAKPSYSDYVTFDGITIPDSGDDNVSDGSYSYMEIYDYQYEYYQGQKFYADLRLVYVSDDGTETYTIISSEECEIEGFNSYKAGEQTVTVRFGELFVTCDVYVKETDEIRPNYSVSLENVKTEYEYGEEFYAEVWVTDIDGNRWHTEDYEVEGFDNTMPGWQTVTIRYDICNELYKVYVAEKDDSENTSGNVEYVYWSEDLPGQLNFTMIDGVDRYRINLYRNDVLITETTHSYGSNWWQNEGYHQFLEEICENGSGTYRAEVAPDDGNDNYTVSEDYVYKKPSRNLEKPQNVVLDRDAHCITWDEVPDARYYNVSFGYSTDGGESFFMMASTQVLPEYDGCYYDMQYDLQWLEEDYIRAAENNGIAIDNLIRVMQIVAFPTNLNDANVSYSDYVTFDAITIPDDGGEPEPVYAVSFENVKTKYEYGEEFYAEAWITDANGEYCQVEGWWVDGFDPYMSGWQTVNLCYGDYSEMYKVYVAEKESTEDSGYIKIVDYQREYYPGEEFYAELLVWERADDGKMYSYEVDISDCQIDGFDSYAPGEQCVTIWYNNYVVDCYVTVYAEEPPVHETIGDGVTWSYDPLTGEFYYYGAGDMPDYGRYNGINSPAPWSEYCKEIKTIIIGDEVTSISTGAFAYCPLLENINFGNNLIKIEGYAFERSPLIKNINLPDSLTTLGNSVFRECYGITEVIFGAGIRNMTDSFSFCENITSITLPEGLTEVGLMSFIGCSGLTEIHLPSTLVNIESSAFTLCKALKDVYFNGTISQWKEVSVSSGNEYLTEADIHCNDGDVPEEEEPEPAVSVTFENVKTEYELGEEFYIEVYQYTTEGIKVALTGWEVLGFDSSVAGEQTVTVRYGEYEETFVVYVNGVYEPSWWEYNPDTRELIIREEMGNYGFDLNAGYTEAPWAHLAQEVEIISIWDGVTSITSGVFINFTNLKEVNLGGTVNRIAPSAFDGCTALEHITIPDSVVNIGTRAFANCGLRTIDLGKGIRVIGPTAFQNCKFETVYLPESLSAIRTGTFAVCRYLKEIHIPASVTKIESGAFNGCIALTDVYFGGTEEEWNNFEIANGSGPVLNVTIHYNNEENPTEYVSFENVKTEYEYGEEFYAEVWVTDIEGNRWQVENYEYHGFDPYVSGWQTVTIRYDEYEEIFDVFVREPEYDEPVVVNVDFELRRDEYYPGEELDIFVYEHMSNGECNRVYDYEIVGFDSTNPGRQMVTINYKGFGQQFVIMVKEPSTPSGPSGGGGGGNDGTGPVITVSQEKGRVGSTVDVTVSISENTGFTNLGLEINYDRALTLVDVKENTNVGATFTGAQDLNAYPYNIGFDSTGNVDYNGTLVTLTFEVPEDAYVGDYFVNVDFYKGRNGDYIDGISVNYDANENPLNLRYENGNINVYNYIPGDINGNGVVDNKDGTALLRYLAGWTTVNVDINTLDVDGNGMVDNKDGTRLLRYLAGWNVEVH